jgi:hypothetical protein
LIREIGGDGGGSKDEHRISIRGKPTRVWWVPADKVHPTPDIEPPDMSISPI